jgi:FkbM family methyltransferase
MLLDFYKSFLKLPNFQGKARISGLIRNSLLTPKLFKVKHGLLMELDPLEWLQIELISSGCMEPLTSDLYEQILGAGDKYLDVGAHVGFHTLLARRLIGSSGYVFAIDPQPYNCQKILANWQANQFENVLVYVAAAGNHNGMVTFCNQRATDKAKLSLDAITVNDQPQQFQVPLMRLTKIFEDNQLTKVKLLKIDVEGYELEVLEGLDQHITKVENLIIEILETPPKFTEKTTILLDKLQHLG